MLIEIVIIICICSINISFSFLSKVDVFRGRRFSSLQGEMNHNEQRRTIQTDSILDKLFRRYTTKKDGSSICRTFNEVIFLLSIV
jgi:hypothetical protein